MAESKHTEGINPNDDANKDYMPKFSITFFLDEGNMVNVYITPLADLRDEDIPSVCTLLYSLNAGLFYQEIVGQLSLDIIANPTSADKTLRLLNLLKKVNNASISVPVVTPTQVFGRLSNG